MSHPVRPPIRLPARIALAGALIILPFLTFALTTSAAEEVNLPAGLEAELLAKVVEYDRNFAARAQERVHILLVVKRSNSDSVHVAGQLQTAISRLSTIAGLPHDEAIFEYTSASELADACTTRRVAIVFVGPGFGDDIASIRAALTGIDILSVTNVPAYVPGGIVLGFDVVEGRPKLLFHLGQARKQNVNLRSDALKLMKVFE